MDPNNNNNPYYESVYGKIDPKKWASNRLELNLCEHKKEFEQNRDLLANNSLDELEYAGHALTDLEASFLVSPITGDTTLRLTLPEYKRQRYDLEKLRLLRGCVGITINDITKPICDGFVLKIQKTFVDIAPEKDLDTKHKYFNLVKTVNDITFQRTKFTLNGFLKKSKYNPLVDLLFGQKPLSDPLPTIPKYNSRLSFHSHRNILWFNKNLNHYQREAVDFSLRQEHLAVIHGPPGTGKTTTLTELILQLITRDIRILVCAASNVAVDNIFKQLLNSYQNDLCAKYSVPLWKYSFVRIGHPSRIDPDILPYALLKSSYGKNRKRNRNKGIGNFQYRKREMTDKLLKANVIMSTLVGASEQGDLKYLFDNNEKFSFDVVIIDECAQASEPITWIPLVHADKCILAGDHQQLPPTVFSDQGRTKGLEVSLLERIVIGGLFNGENVLRMLKEQHRMNQVIMKWPSETFYDDQLVASSRAEFRRLGDVNLNPLRLIDTSGCSFEEVTVKDIDIFKASKGNHHEAKIVYLVIKDFLDQGISPSKIGIISPYKLQNIMIEEICRERLERNKFTQLEINSVDGFQGREKDIIIMSLVRSNRREMIGFLKEHRRLNVAITRARCHLTMIADCSTIQSSETFNDFFRYCRNNPSCDNERADQYRERMESIPDLDLSFLKSSVRQRLNHQNLFLNDGDIDNQLNYNQSNRNRSRRNQSSIININFVDINNNKNNNNLSNNLLSREQIESLNNRRFRIIKINNQWYQISSIAGFQGNWKNVLIQKGLLDGVILFYQNPASRRRLFPMNLNADVRWALKKICLELKLNFEIVSLNNDRKQFLLLR